MRDSGYKAYTSKKKPRLTKKHKSQRLQFAEKYSEWTTEDWKSVFFSDEVKVNRIGSDGQEYSWRKPLTCLKDHNVTPTVKFGGGYVMVWGCFCHSGVGKLIRIEGKMTAIMYCDVLSKGFIPSVQNFQQTLDEVVLQQDNDPKHKAKVTQKWIQNKGIQLLDWPSMSPDLNPIENLWHFIKNELKKYNDEPKGVNELWDRINLVWNRIPVKLCEDLVNSMPKRINLVKKAKGSYTKY